MRERRELNQLASQPEAIPAEQPTDQGQVCVRVYLVSPSHSLDGAAPGPILGIGPGHVLAQIERDNLPPPGEEASERESSPQGKNQRVKR